MRVTNTMLANNINASLFRQTELMYRTQERIATGKKINRPSDDPVGMTSALGYRNSISNIDQYNDNITKGKMHIETMDQVLEMVEGFLRGAKDIAFDDAPDRRLNLAENVATIRDQVLELCNYEIDGDYIFSGHVTDTPPFDWDATNTFIEYNGSNNSKAVIIGRSTQIDIAADGEDIFQNVAVADIFDELIDLEADLIAGIPADITSHINPLERAIEQLDIVRAKNASVYNQMEATENHYSYFKLNLQDLLSRTEDADIAESIVSFKAQEAAYESTLATSSMIMQKSLIDFLR